MSILHPFSAITRQRTITTITKRHYSAPTSSSIAASKQKYIPTSGTYPLGFTASSTHVGVKASNTTNDDLALIASDRPCTAAAVFTKNRFQAAPVSVTREMLKSRGGEGIWGVVVNSGCANAVTGKGGVEDAKLMVEAADRCLQERSQMGATTGGGDVGRSIVMSTGVIGQRLPITKILDGIPNAVSSLGSTHAHWLRTARAICTTDTFPKLISTEFTVPRPTTTTTSSSPSSTTPASQTYRITGMTKGAGMIHPNMATLLSIICTDAAVLPDVLQTALKHAVDRSFNCISVDGDTSTNDTVAILANGAAAQTTPSTNLSAATTTSPSATTASIWEGRTPSSSTIDSTSHPSYPVFLTALTNLCTQLSHLIIRDGEGATKFLTLRIRDAPTRAIGLKIASTIAKSPLVKTAMYGRDANWGRILCAVGYTDLAGLDEGDTVKPGDVSVSFVPTTGMKERSGSNSTGELKLVVNGEPQLPVDEARAAELLAEEDIEVLIRLKPEVVGGGSVTSGKVAQWEGGHGPGGGEEEGDVLFWTCDFSHEYVTINGDYRT